MHAQQDIDGSLVLTYDSSGWTKWFYGAAVLLLIIAGYDYFISAHNDRMIGLLAGTGICILAGLAFHEKAYTRVDPVSKTITWSRRIAFWRKGGTLRFSEVRDVIIEKTTGTRKVPSKRISLHLKDGSFLPLTYGSGPDVDGNLANAAALFRKVLSQQMESSNG